MNFESRVAQVVYSAMPYWMKDFIATTYGLRQRRHRQGQHYSRYLQSLEESQWWSNEQLLQEQLQRTKEMLCYAEDHCRFYKQMFHDRGFVPAAMHAMDSLATLPILTKQVIREHMDEVVSDELPRLKPTWSHTSGTTGEGLVFPESLECFQREFAFRVKCFEWTGVKFGDRWAYCAGHAVAPYGRTRPPFWVHDRANGWLLMSSYHLSESNMPHYIEELRRFGPDLIAGYPSSVYLLALANMQSGRPVRSRAVATSSETLFSFQRSVIEDSFQCKCYSFYGNAERTALGCQCEFGTFHLRSEHSYVEILGKGDRPAGPGEEGRLVCTPFGNRAMPLVRYDVGDVALIAAEQQCACGRGGILLEQILGRAEDYVLTPEGRYVGRLDHIFKDAVNVRAAQIHQTCPDAVTIRIVRGPGYSRSDEESILRKARFWLGNRIAIETEYVSDLPRTKAGKLRLVVSNIGRLELGLHRSPG